MVIGRCSMNCIHQQIVPLAMILAFIPMLGCGNILIPETSKLTESVGTIKSASETDKCSIPSSKKVAKYARTDAPELATLLSTVKAKQAGHYDQDNPSFWSVHANLTTALELYRATGSADIAKVLTTEARNLYTMKGSSRNIRDYSKRVKIAGWPVKRANKDAHLSYYLIDQANVLVPMLGFFLEPEVNENPVYNNLKGKWINIADQIFQSFEVDLIDDGPGAYYVWPSKIDKIATHRDYTPGAPLPYNMTVQMGHAALLLSKLSSGPQRKNTETLPRLLVEDLKLVSLMLTSQTPTPGITGWILRVPRT